MSEPLHPLLVRLQERRRRHRARSLAYRVAHGVAGAGVLLAGTAMLVLPGPGAVVMIAGLTMLALEFAWAEEVLGQALELLERAKRKTAGRWRRAAIGLLAVAGLSAGLAVALLWDVPFLPV